MSGGEASALFDRYLRDSKSQHVALDFETLTVYAYTTSGERQSIQAKMTLGRLFAGMTFDQVWRKTLKGMKVIGLDNPEAEATALNADVICGN